MYPIKHRLTLYCVRLFRLLERQDRDVEREKLLGTNQRRGSLCTGIIRHNKINSPVFTALTVSD